MPAPLQWMRKSSNSANVFDLVLTNPQELDSERMNELLNGILEEKHRGLTLSFRAVKELRRWFDQPDTPLRSDAYVLLSNWFTTQSGDRLSRVAIRCEALWDALFLCRPVERLSSPAPGRNHLMVPAAFESFWRRLLAAHGEGIGESNEAPTASNVKPRSQTGHLHRAGDGSDSTPSQLRAMFEKEGLHIEVEGSPGALAEFLQIVSGWEAS